jgi:hypothetical protein
LEKIVLAFCSARRFDGLRRADSFAGNINANSVHANRYVRADGNIHSTCGDINRNDYSSLAAEHEYG